MVAPLPVLGPLPANARNPTVDTTPTKNNGTADLAPPPLPSMIQSSQCGAGCWNNFNSRHFFLLVALLPSCDRALLVLMTEHTTSEEEPMTTTTTSGAADPDKTSAKHATLVVKVKSVDDVEFELPLAAAKQSQLIRDSLPDDLEELDEDKVDTIEPIDLLRVGSRALEKVVAFLIHHHEEPMKEIPTPLQHNSFNEVRMIPYARQKMTLNCGCCRGCVDG